MKSKSICRRHVESKAQRNRPAEPLARSWGIRTAVSKAECESESPPVHALPWDVNTLSFARPSLSLATQKKGHQNHPWEAMPESGAGGRRLPERQGRVHIRQGREPQPPWLQSL